MSQTRDKTDRKGNDEIVGRVIEGQTGRNGSNHSEPDIDEGEGIGTGEMCAFVKETGGGGAEGATIRVITGGAVARGKGGLESAGEGIAAGAAA